MARFALILSILIGLAAAYFGVTTKQRVEGLQSNLTDAKAATTAAQSAEKKAKGELAESQKALEAAQTDLKAKEEEATKAKAEAQEASSKLASAESKAKAAEKQIADIQAELDKAKTVGGEQMKATEILAKLQEANDQKTKLETELAESKQVQQTLQARADELQGKFSGLESQIAEYKSGAIRAGLSGKVLAYNPGWNFVVLNIGDKSGLKSGAQMVVTRSGALIGKVKVTTVEPSTAIADVLPGTLAAGESVQPGDAVVFEGKR